jgi:uncharacterized iron-regulated membrane protein
MKKICRKLHLWLSIPLGIFIALVCLTGALLVFEEEINHLTNPELYYVEAGESTLDPNFLAEKVGETLPDSVQVVSVTTSKDAEKSWMVGLSKPHHASVAVNPYTGEVLGRVERKPFFDKVLKLHRYLLDAPAQRGEMSVGKCIVGISVLVFVFILLTGIVWWFPTKQMSWGGRFAISVKGGCRKFWTQMHHAGGIYALIFLLLMSLTGLTWSFGWYRNGFYALLGENQTEMRGEGRGGRGEGFQGRGGEGRGGRSEGFRGHRGEGRGEGFHKHQGKMDQQMESEEAAEVKDAAKEAEIQAKRAAKKAAAEAAGKSAEVKEQVAQVAEETEKTSEVAEEAVADAKSGASQQAHAHGDHPHGRGGRNPHYHHEGDSLAAKSQEVVTEAKEVAVAEVKEAAEAKDAAKEAEIQVKRAVKKAAAEAQVEAQQADEQREVSQQADAQSGASKQAMEITVKSDQDAPNGVKAWVYQLHTGKWGGIYSKILYFIACLIGTSLPITGYWLWLSRRKKRNANDEK